MTNNMFNNFTEDMFNQFKASRHPKTGNYKFPKKTAEAFYSDIIREFPTLRRIEPISWSKETKDAIGIKELFNITSGTSRFYDFYFDGLEHNELTLALCFADSFENLEERLIEIITDETEEFRFFDPAMHLDENKDEWYKMYADLYDIALKFSKVTHIDVIYKDNTTERFFRSSNKNRLGYNWITLSVLLGYFKEKDFNIFNTLKDFYSPYREEVYRIVDPKGNVIISF